MRSCGKRRFASGSRREPQDVLLRGPPPLPKAALLTPSSAWNEGCGSHIHREAPACSCQALPAKGLWCWKPGIGWLSAPGQLFARILDINPSRRFCTWCFHVAANVPLSISQSAAFLVPCPLCPVPRLPGASPLLLADIPWCPAQSLHESGAPRGGGGSLG